MKEFKPKTRTQIYNAALCGTLTPDDVTINVERVPYKNKDDNQPIVNIPVSFEAGTGYLEGSYIATVNTYDEIDKNTEVLLNGVSVEERDPSKTYSAGDLFFVSGQDSRGWNIIEVVSFQAEPVAADYVISAYAMVSTVDMAAIQPKTRKEKYLASAAKIDENPIYTGLIPEPKTVDEYYTFLMSRGKPAGPAVGPANPGINDGGVQHGIA